MRASASTWIKPTFDATAVDVERLEDFEDLIHGQTLIDRPEDNVEVFAAVFEVFEDGIDQWGSPEIRRQKPKIPLIQLDPECLTLEMLKPSMPQETIPMFSDPGAYRRFAQVPARLLTLDPLET